MSGLLDDCNSAATSRHDNVRIAFEQFKKPEPPSAPDEFKNEAKTLITEKFEEHAALVNSAISDLFGRVMGFLAKP